MNELLRAFPDLNDCHFLNWAGTGVMPRPSAEVFAEFARQGSEPMARHFEAWLERLEQVRALTAGMVGASPEEIAFVPNTSTGLSLIAQTIGWRPGDKIVFPADEFPSNRFVWQNLTALGVEAVAVPPEPGKTFAEQLAERSLDGVRLVAFSVVSYLDGRREDPAEVVRVCRRASKDILVAADAIQAVGAVPFDVRDCDFVACGGQKWLLGPVGSGFLYIAARHLDTLHMPLVGWASSRDVGDFAAPRLEFCAGARRLEPGLPDIAALAAFGRSLELLRDAGHERVHERVAELESRLRESLKALDLKTLNDGPRERRSGIVTAELPPGTDDDALVVALADAGVYATVRGGLLRAAAHAMTRDEDIDALLKMLAIKGRAVAMRDQPSRTPTTFEPTRPPGESGHWKHAIITGASRGLGAAIARELAVQGCSLTLIARDGARLENLAAQLRNAHAVAVETVALDLADAAALKTWAALRPELLARCDLLVNAAVMADAQPFAQSDFDAWRRTFEVNALAPAVLARAVLDGMLEREQGAILNIATSGARCALPLFAAYAGSKGALWAWSEALTREVAASQVSVTTFVPPHMSTATAQRLGRTALAYYRLNGKQPRQVPPRQVARQALAAAAKGDEFVAGWRTRLTLAYNALAPTRISRRLRRLVRQY